MASKQNKPCPTQLKEMFQKDLNTTVCSALSTLASQEPISTGLLLANITSVKIMPAKYAESRCNHWQP